MADRTLFLQYKTSYPSDASTVYTISFTCFSFYFKQWKNRKFIWSKCLRQYTLATYIQLSLYMACGSNLMHWNIRQQMKTNSTQQTHIVNDTIVRDRGQWGVQGWPRKQSPNTKQQPAGCSLAGAAETSQRTLTSQFPRIQDATQNWFYQREKRVPILRWE